MPRFRPFSEGDLPNPDGMYVSRSRDNPREARVHTVPGGEVCDFCSAHEPLVAVYGCRDTTIASLPIVDAFGPTMEDHVSEGGWGACAECAFLIDRAEVKGLADRAARAAIASLPELKQLPLAKVRRTFMDGQQAFWKNRTGEKRPWTQPRRHGGRA